MRGGDAVGSRDVECAVGEPVAVQADPERRGRYEASQTATTGPGRRRVPILTWVTPSVTMSSAQGSGAYYDGSYASISFASDPSALQVINGVLIEPSDGGAVRALDVVGIDLELWFCVHFCIIGEQYIVVLLVSQSTLCIFMNKYPSVKSASRHIIKDSLKKLVACTFGKCMIYINIIINMLELVGKK